MMRKILDWLWIDSKDYSDPFSRVIWLHPTAVFESRNKSQEWDENVDQKLQIACQVRKKERKDFRGSWIIKTKLGNNYISKTQSGVHELLTIYWEEMWVNWRVIFVFLGFTLAEVYMKQNIYCFLGF